MKKLVFAFALFALATPGLWAAAHDETERVNQTLKLQPGGTLRLKSFSGRVNITAADGNEVVIQAVRHGSRDRLDHIKLDIHADGSTIYVDANKRDSWWLTHNNVVETDFDIKVPRKTNIDVNVFSAPVTIEGVEGTYKIGGFSSRIRLDDIAGSVKAHTFSGPVEIHAKAWKDGQDVDVDTFSGNVTLRVPDDARGTVHFNSFSGHLNSELPLTFRNGGRRSLRAELGSHAERGGTLRFKTFSGSVKIDR
jgi:DUF4097 and DUF4098 domain-containing protein YvlB